MRAGDQAVKIRRVSSIGATLLVVALLTGCGTRTAAFPRSTGSAPRSAQDVALADFLSHFQGEVSEVYASATTTLADWRKVEPGNTSGISGEPGEEDKTLFVVFLKGPFTRLDPGNLMGSESPVAYDEARLIFDDAGTLLNTRVWVSAGHGPPFSTGDPAVDAAFDD